jgi:hypothetical protein
MNDENRNFGILLTVLTLIYSIYLFQINSNFFILFLSISIFLILISTLFSKFLALPRLWWINIGKFFGKITSPIFMIIIYVITILPIAIIFKLLNKDPLEIKNNYDKNSFWKIPDDDGSMNDQF